MRAGQPLLGFWLWHTHAFASNTSSVRGRSCELPVRSRLWLLVVRLSLMESEEPLLALPALWTVGRTSG
eukprot:3845604-Amphidinium_carterae.1